MGNKLQRGCWQLVDGARNMICPCIYDMILPYIGDYAPVCLDGKWGTVDRQGRRAIPAEYAFVGGIRGRFAVVAMERKGKGFLFRIVDENGRGDALRYENFDDALEELEARCDAPEARDGEEGCSCDGFEGGLFEGAYCTIDHARELLIPGIHGCCFPISEDYLAALEKGCDYSAKPGENKWGIVDIKTYMPILPFAHEDLNMVDKHLVKVKKNGKWGIADARIPAYHTCVDI